MVYNAAGFYRPSRCWRNIASYLPLITASITGACSNIQCDFICNNPLRVSMVAASGSAADFLGSVEVSITNTSNHTVRVPRWALPSDFVEAKLFRVSLDGAEVQYEGPMIKRPLPQAADFEILRAGETRRTVVDLSAAYDLSRTGQYTVTFASPLQFASTSDGRMLRTARGLPMIAQSAPLSLWVDGSDQLGAAKVAGLAGGHALEGALDGEIERGGAHGVQFEGGGGGGGDACRV